MKKEKQFKSAIAQYMSTRRPNTERRYAYCVNSFSEFLGRKSLTSAKPADAVAYLSGLRSAGAADRTIRNTYSALRVLYQFGVELDLIHTNPFAVAKRVISMRQVRDVRPTKFIEFERVPKILASIHPVNHDNLGSQKTAIRDRAIMGIFFGCGLRLSEVLDLSVGAIHVYQSIAYLEIDHSKSGKRRRVPLNDWAMQHIAPLVSQRKSDGAGADDPLLTFYYADGRARTRIAMRTLSRLYKLHTGAAPHSARKTYITRLLRTGATAAEAARAAGHGDTAQIHVYEEALRLEDSPGRLLSY